MSDSSGSEENEDEQEEEEEEVYDDPVEFIFELYDKEGYLEAPIDLNISRMKAMELNPLMWYNHDSVPKKLKITNTGYTVILSAKWMRERPYLIGGPFREKYVFSQLHFHWGRNEMVGSEHYVDGSCMPMELHAVHFKANYLNQDAALREKDGIVILVYLFKLQPSKNPTFNDLMEALPLVRDPNSSCRIPSRVPFVNFLRPFDRDYFLYWGALSAESEAASITHPVLWLVSRDSIGISQEQIAQFRSLYSVNYEPLLHNCRELQERQDRHIFHVNPSGKCSSSLLPIPREPPPLTANQIIQMVENYEPSEQQD